MDTSRQTFYNDLMESLKCSSTYQESSDYSCLQIRRSGTPHSSQGRTRLHRAFHGPVLAGYFTSCYGATVPGKSVCRAPRAPRNDME